MELAKRSGASGLRECVAMAFLYRLLDPEDPWGLGLLDVEDEQAARAIGASGPAVEGGTCTFEVVPMQLVRPG
jgi:hypothetical protein